MPCVPLADTTSTNLTTMSEKKSSTLSSALSATFVALGVANLILLAIYLIISITDVVGSGIDYFEDGSVGCYVYRNGISCTTLSKAAPLSTKVPKTFRPPVWGVDQG